jgi:hypothetical protein
MRGEHKEEETADYADRRRCSERKGRERGRITEVERAVTNEALCDTVFKVNLENEP